MGQHVYLDANVLIPLLWDRDPEQRVWSESIIKPLRGDVQTYDRFRVKIPKLVVGEIVNEYCEDCLNGEISTGREPPQDTFMEELLDIVEQLDATFCSVKSGTWKVARQLRRDDRELCHNDLCIASIVVQDDDSTHLISGDSHMLETRSITKIADDRASRNHGLKVTNEY